MFDNNEIILLSKTVHKFFMTHEKTAPFYSLIKDNIFIYPIDKIPIVIKNNDPDDPDSEELDNKVSNGSIGLVIAELRKDLNKPSDKDIVIIAFAENKVVTVMGKRRVVYLEDTYNCIK